MLLLLLLLPFVAEEVVYRRSTYIPKTIPVALPEQQRHCVVMVGYIDRQSDKNTFPRTLYVVLVSINNYFVLWFGDSSIVHRQPGGQWQYFSTAVCRWFLTLSSFAYCTTTHSAVYLARSSAVGTLTIITHQKKAKQTLSINSSIPKSSDSRSRATPAANQSSSSGSCRFLLSSF